MNRLLASIVGWLNAVLAIVIILVCAGMGYAVYEALVRPGTGLLGLVLGAVIGFIVAALVCGAMALLIDMRNNLRQLVYLSRESAYPSNGTNVHAPTGSAARE